MLVRYTSRYLKLNTETLSCRVLHISDVADFSTVGCTWLLSQERTTVLCCYGVIACQPWQGMLHYFGI